MNKGTIDATSCMKLFNTHRMWAAHIVEVCLEKKTRPIKHYHDFRRYTDKLYDKCADVFVNRGSELTLRQTIQVLSNGMITNLKDKANIRKMGKFMLN